MLADRRIGILVVHGVGEQKCFEHLEEIAGNLYNALAKDPARQAHVQIGLGNQAPLHSPTWGWQETPASVRWRSELGGWIEAVFREVHWADLDEPMTVRRWIDFVLWALAMPGVRPYNVSPASVTQVGLRRLPRRLTRVETIRTRAELFGVSLLFLLILLSINLFNAVLARLSIKLSPLEKAQETLYNFVGDVKLYQDWFVRMDNNLEAIGEKSRVAIRRRMVRALLRTAEAVRTGELDGYYIFAHSLGTVVAFNGLMELNGILPRYLTEEEWNGLNPVFKASDQNQNLYDQAPRRPPWIQPTDQIDRRQLFAGLRGFLTMGSPLDKFAALWPLIVPINAQPLPNPVPWVNVADRQDIVAGTIDLFSGTNNVGGLQLTNVPWADQVSPFTAHTSYWKVNARNPDRLIDRLIPWLEGRPLVPPADRFPSFLAPGLFWLWILLSSGALLVLMGSGPWLLERMFDL
ncbi:MAG: hypothetical protein AB1411_04980 [Nitrospirota bacterium]